MIIFISAVSFIEQTHHSLILSSVYAQRDYFTSNLLDCNRPIEIDLNGDNGRLMYLDEFRFEMSRSQG